ncbi:MAG: 6-phosphogluconolactonase [Chromatiaceae bacterium]|nr:6-phosphogluconolactonase [Gammaproteobacteria bacterium]MCP5301361.1 6-phosphogluconolactonase [Chromatiaceae bacterium]MCP5306626.1 6-phosphogluconolactonase [Chromatiaceae bacterium]MCP5421873.1 6-phosphogluconolactonase [Chromatiaceae bacterium]
MGASWQTEIDPAAVADAACRLVGVAARKAIAERGVFRLVLSGGSTPKATYERLANSDQQWKRWVLYYGDERCLPADDPERNSVMVASTGLAARVGKHYPIPTELGAKQAASKYRPIVKAAQPFDLVLLGIGEDGHTASLFPGQKWPDKSVFAISDAPKPPASRVTLGIRALQNCATMLVLITGDSKADAVRRWRAGDDLPVARVSDVDHALVLIDKNCLMFAGGQAEMTGESIRSGR